MFTLLAPYALFGSLLLAVPIVVHLFRPRKVRQTPFSSLRWLRLSPQKLSRRIQWHQVLLFLVRAAFVVTLVFSLARPVFGPASDTRPVDRFIILDVSRSMDYRVSGRPTPLERARQVAEDLLVHGRAGDRTALLLTGSSTRIITPLSRDAAARVPELREVTAGLTGTDLSSALSVVRPMLGRQPADRDVELYFLTDNHQGSWDQGAVAAFLKDLPAPVRVCLVDVGITAPQNAWIAGARLLSSSGTRRLLGVEVAAVGAEQERTVCLRGLAGVPERTQTVTVTPGRPAPVEFELPEGYDLRGQVAHLCLEPPDGLANDDEFFLPLDHQMALKVLLVEPDTEAVEALRTGLHLQSAVEALAASGRQSIELTRRTTTTAVPHDFSEADIVLLAGVPDLTEAQLGALEGRVRAGAGLVLFLGPAVQVPFYNSKLYRPLQPDMGLLPVPLKAVAEPREGPAGLSSVRWTHPLLAPLYDPVLGDLATTHFKRFFRFGAAPRQADTVLAWIDEDVPAVIERAVGTGKVVLFNTTANDDWSGLPRRKSFVPLTDRLLSYLSGGGVRHSFEVGEPVALPLPDARPGDVVTVRAPDRTIHTPTLTTAGGRTLLRLGEATQPGVYRVEHQPTGGQDVIFVANVGRADSVLTPMDAAVLAKWWEPASFEVVGVDTVAGQLAPTDRLDLWPWLLALAGVLLLVETFLVHWLCPRAVPAAAEVVVRRGSLLRPLKTSAE